jgi:acetyltransferase-like isoleucine patch superfamily enzyme
MVARCRRALDWLENYDDERYQSIEIGRDVRLGSAVVEPHCRILDHSYLTGKIHIGSYSCLGYHNTLHGGVITVGRYCEFGPYVTLYTLNHALDYVTTYNNRRLFGGRLKRLASGDPVRIGHDVWIGHGAIILPGVMVGNGAVIGAGAVVTKNVCDYGVAVGNPARVIRRRFDDEIIDLLSQWQWWNLEPAALLDHEELFMTHVGRSREQVEEALWSLREGSPAPAACVGAGAR